MKKKVTVLSLCAVLFAPCWPIQAQQPAKVYRIGYLTPVSLSANAARIEAFRQGLRELGYVEGQSIVIEWQYAEGKFDRLPDLAAELVRLKVDVIVTTGGRQAIQAAKNTTNMTPIVTTATGDPVGDALIASLARPGGNITGRRLQSSTRTRRDPTLGRRESAPRSGRSPPRKMLC
jgi:putative ABC transport system substrate-binding protein